MASGARLGPTQPASPSPSVVDGTYELHLGTSWRPKVRRNEHKNYTSLRFDFRPETIDQTRPGTLSVTPESDATVEYYSTVGQDIHEFRGKASSCPAIECLLVFDPQTQTFTLEKHTTRIALSGVRRAPAGGAASTVSRPMSPVVTAKATIPAAEASASEATASAVAVDNEDQDDDDIARELAMHLDDSSSGSSSSSDSSSSSSEDESQDNGPAPKRLRLKKASDDDDDQ